MMHRIKKLFAGIFSSWITPASAGEGQSGTISGGSRQVLLSGAALAMLGGCLVLVFLISAMLYIRLDFSEGRLYSLSGGSKRLLRSLDAPVEVRAYFSKELPPHYAALRSYTMDLLGEYRDASKGKVRFSFPDMEKDGGQDAAKQGIMPVQFNVVSKEKLEVREGYMGLVMQREDKKEVIHVLSDSKGLEYDITSRIVRLAAKKRKSIGVVTGQGALSAASFHPELREMVERNYEIRDVNLGELAASPTSYADIAALLLLGPKEKLADEQIYALDQFLLSGRPLVMALDSRRVDVRSFYAQGLENGLAGFLRHHGFSIRNNMVLDMQNQKVSVAQQRGWLVISNIIDYPPLVISNDLGREHPVTRDLNAMTLPFVSPIEVSTKTASGEVRVLARSSKASWLKTQWDGRGFASVNPLNRDMAPETGDPRGPFVLAAELEDYFSSYFSTATASGVTFPKKAAKKDFIARSPRKGHLLVLGTSMFADPQLSARDANGQIFLMNLMEWSALDSDLISIRAKRAVFRPLREVSVAVKRLVRWGNILLPPVLVVVFGVFRFWRARRKRASRVRMYNPEAAHA